MLQKVASTGVSLDSVYTQTLQRIREQKGDRSRLGMEVLMWVSHSAQSLRISELQHALAVEIESTDLDPENVRPRDTVLRSCLGLVVVDEETSTVRLIHYTLQEYLSEPGILPNAHKTLGQTCLAYLNYERVKGLPVGVEPNLADMPFLNYSSLYWGIHAKEGLSDGAKSLALELLDRYDNHISSTFLFNHIGYFIPYTFPPYFFTGLHCASYFGIVEVVTALIEMKDHNINQRDCTGRTPLMWATQQANEEVVGLLLTRDDVNPDEPDNSGQTALSWASSLGYEGVVRLLLTRDDVNLGEPDIDGRTALWWAYTGRHMAIVALLRPRTNVLFRISITLIFAVILGVSLLQVSNTLIIIYVWYTLIPPVSFLCFPGQKCPPRLASWIRHRWNVALLQRQKSLDFCFSVVLHLVEIYRWRKKDFRLPALSQLPALSRLFLDYLSCCLFLLLTLSNEKTLGYFISVIVAHAFLLDFLRTIGTYFPLWWQDTCWSMYSAWERGLILSR